MPIKSIPIFFISLCRLHYHLTLKDPKEVADWEEGFVKAIKGRGEEFSFIQDQYGKFMFFLLFSFIVCYFLSLSVIVCYFLLSFSGESPLGKLFIVTFPPLFVIFCFSVLSWTTMSLIYLVLVTWVNFLKSGKFQVFVRKP